MNFEIVLRKLGLTYKQARIYLACLELGTASAQEIAKKADIFRTTAYSILENLAFKGFIFKTKEKNRNRYLAESPKNLIRRFSRYYSVLKKNLPELEALYNSHQIKPKIVFYEGKKGIRQIYADTIKEKPKEILEFNTSDMFIALPKFPNDYVTQRKKNRIYARRIAPDDQHWQEHAGRDKYELSQTILLPLKDFEIPVEVNVYNDKLAFMSYSDEVGIIIESKGIAKAMRRIYELLWDKLKK